MPKLLDKPTAKKTKPVKPADLANRLFELREKKRKLEATIKELEEEAKPLEQTLIETMLKEKLEKFSTDAGSISTSTSIVADVTDRDAFSAYILKTKQLHLLQFRVSDPAYRELLEQGKDVPGVSPFSKIRLNLRAA